MAAALPAPSRLPAEPAGADLKAPADLKRTDEAGAAAAASHFLQLWGYTLQTGDVTEWDAMSDDLCQFCLETRELTLWGQEAREVFTGGDITTGSTYVHPFDDARRAYAVDVHFLQTPSERHSATGELIAANTWQYGTLKVDVTRLEGGWEVLEVTAQDVQ